MKYLKRLWKTLKWLFNHPPIGINQEPVVNGKVVAEMPCSYCGKIDGPTNGGYTCLNPVFYKICFPCIKKVLDHVLISESPNE